VSITCNFKKIDAFSHLISLREMKIFLVFTFTS
jgi:hypothetical protein